MKKYDVVEYWNDRDDPCSKNIEEFTKINIDYIKKQVSECKKILDFGPGYGRMFSAYIDACEVIGIDVTDKHKNELMNEAKKQGFNFELKCIKKQVICTDYKDKYFDAVISSQVFLHQPPDIIEKIMKELIRIGKKVVVITYMDMRKRYDNIKKYKADNKYCFNYNYYELCKKNNWNIVNIEKFKNQFMFVYEESINDNNRINCSY